MIARAIGLVNAAGVPKERFEFQMLYGIQRKEQERLAREGWGVNVLISYGRIGFPGTCAGSPSVPPTSGS